MIADTTENLHDLGYIWKQWGGKWTPDDEVHFEYPGFSSGAVSDPRYPACDLSELKNWIFWSPECACRVVDFIKAPLVGTLFEIGWPESQIANLLAHPCASVLEFIEKNGL
jgi:hypothetical protein